MDFAIVYFGLLSVVIAFLAHQLHVVWKRQRMVRKSGCKPIVRFPTKGLGKDYAKHMEQAIKEGRLNASSREEFEACGSSTFERSTWDELLIHTTEPLNHQTLVTNMDDWIREPRLATRVYSGENILVQNGHAWRRSRSLVNPLFSRVELNDTKHFRVFVDRMMDLIPRDGSTVDMQALLRKLYVDSATDFIFGQTIDSLRDSSGKSDEFINAYDRATIGAGKRARPTGYLMQLYFTIMRDDEWLAACKVVHDFIDDCIARHRDPNQKLPEARKRYVLIDGMSEVIPNPTDLRFQLLSIFSLARENPAVVASNALFLLARNPSMWTELRNHALALGSKENVTFDELMSLAPFRYTVLETMRLHSPITRIRRIAARDTVLPRGGGADGTSPAFVPKGAVVWIHKFPASRDSRIWGDDIEAFRPSRFKERTLGWEFSPFSSGPRNCPAHRQVIAQAIYLLLRLTLEFESIESRDPCSAFIEGVMMCIYSRNGSLISLKSPKRT